MVKDKGRQPVHACGTYLLLPGCDAFNITPWSFIGAAWSGAFCRPSTLMIEVNLKIVCDHM